LSKKSDDEGNEFYYIGQVIPTKHEQTKIKNDKGQEKLIVNFKLKLKEEVRHDVYDYLVN